MYSYNKYLKNIISNIHELVNSKQGGEKNKGGNKKETKEEVEEPKKTNQVFDKASKCKIIFFSFNLLPT